MSHFLLNNKFLILIFFILTTSFAICAKKNPPPKVIGDNLQFVKNKSVDLEYVHPNINWKKFKNVYIKELSITSQAKNTTPKFSQKNMSNFRESWIIPDSFIKIMKEDFKSIMIDSLGKRNILIVDSPQKDTLIIVPSIIDIYLTAPIESSRDVFEDVYTAGSGSISISAIMGDGSNNKVIALIQDNKYPSTFWSENTKQSNTIDMKIAFRSWGKMFAKTFTRLNTE